MSPVECYHTYGNVVTSQSGVLVYHAFMCDTQDKIGNREETTLVYCFELIILDLFEGIPHK